MVGICFGHQIIAKALGGVVSKSDKGWGVGIHTYELDKAPFDGAQSGQLKLVVSHQDQVHELPPGARNVVSNAHCDNAGFVMGDHIFTLQGHPEFIDEYSEAIMSFRYDMIGADRVARGAPRYSSTITRAPGRRLDAEFPRKLANCSGELFRRYREAEENVESHHDPVFSIDAHGSCAGSASPSCNSSIEMPSGDFTKAMRPSRGGRLITTPASCSF